MTLTVSRRAAARFLVRRGGLGRAAGEPATWPDPGHTEAAVRALEYIQIDPMYVIERNHHLVLAARVGGYRPEALERLLYEDRRLVEVMGANRYIIPVDDYPLFRMRFSAAERAHRPHLEDLEPVMDQVLRRLREDGPLSSLDIEDDRKISGWWDADGEAGTRVVRQALEWLWNFGRVVVSRREGGRRIFDLPERFFGPEAACRPYVPGRAPTGEEDGGLTLSLARKYIRAMGLCDPRDWSFAWTKLTASERRLLVASLASAGEIVPVQVEGVGVGYYIPADEAKSLTEAERWQPEPEIRFLPPLDNLIWLRSRLREVFGFDYVWEAYIPAAKRRFGPYTCPILYGDAIVGRIDARMDRRGTHGRGQHPVLVVNGVWWENDRRGAGDRPGKRAFRRALENWAAVNGARSVDWN